MEDFAVKDDDIHEIKENSSKQKSGFPGLIEVFYNPTGLFNRIKNNPKILIPYIVYIIVTFGFLYLISDLIVQFEMKSEEFQQRTQGIVVTDAMIANMRLLIVLFGVLVWAMIPLVSAGLASFWGNVIMAGKVGFKNILSVSLYSEFLFLVGSLLLTPFMLAKGSLMVSLSPAILVTDKGIESLIYVTLSKISLFHIWEIIVSGIGFSIIFNIKRNKGYILAVLSIGLLSVTHIVVKAIGELLA